MNTESLTLPGIIRALGRGKSGTRDLSFDESFFTMSKILSGEITGPQLGAFLMLMRVKEETPEEIAGMVTACHSSLDYQPSQSIDVNWPAYAGKKKQASWYILAAKLLSQNGIKIFIHGGGEHTAGRQYAANVCEVLSIPIASTLVEAEKQISSQSISYLPITGFLPTLSDLIDMKAELGLRSPVNTLVRHLNPLAATLTLQGMFHPAYMRLHHQAAILLKQNNNLVVKGDGGEFEIRPDSETKVAINSQHNPFEDLVPPVLSQRQIRPDNVSMEPLLALWQGSEQNAYGEAATLQTAAMVHCQLTQSDFKDSLNVVTGWWQSRHS